MDTALKINELQQQNETLQAQVANLAATVSKMDVLIKYYEEQLLMMKRHRFGASSERTVIDNDEYRQMMLYGETEPETSNNADVESELEEISYKRKKRKGKREEDLSGLPIERIDYELPEDERGCPKCGEAMKDIGVDVRRELKLIPAQVVVEEHATHAYACKNTICEEKNGAVTIIKAAAPAPLLAGSLASPSLVSHISVQKYSMGLPLYRIEKGFQYDGIEITRQNMSNWVIKCSETYLSAIYSLLIKYLLQETELHSDETTVQVLHEPGRAAQSKSYEWIYRTSGYSKHKIAIYDYKETRKQEHPATFLKDFKGFLHTDGYQVYHNLPPDIVVVGCWAHARRPWEKLLKTIPKEKQKGTDAERGAAYINRLFKLERSFAELSPEERYQKRLEYSKPLANEFFDWAYRLGALPKSPLGDAVHYAMSQRKYLENVFKDGKVELSNNRAERSVKPFVMGRKAWLFSNTPNGAAASSVMYSIIETAKENGLNPFQYVKYLLETLPNATTDNLERYLPWSGELPDCCKLPIKETDNNAKKKRN